MRSRPEAEEVESLEMAVVSSLVVKERGSASGGSSTGAVSCSTTVKFELFNHSINNVNC